MLIAFNTKNTVKFALQIMPHCTIFAQRSA